MDLLRERLRCTGAQRLACADAPDTTELNKAAASSAQLGRDAFDFFKSEYERTAPDRAEAAALAKEQAGLQNELAKTQIDLSQQERQRYLGTFAPIEQSIAADAMGYDTPQRREQAARAATADVQMQLEGQRGATERAMERSGVLPSSGKVMALQGLMDVGAAKAKAGAANTARQQVETVGAAKKMDAAGLGRGVIGTQGTTAGIALNAGNSAVNNGQAPVNIAAAGAGLMGQGFNTAMQGQGQAGSLYGQAANIQQRASEANSAAWGALGGAAGSVLGGSGGGITALAALSDENEKEDIAPASDEEALEAVRETPVEQWRYKADSPAADGGQKHVGPMAQDVAASMGMDAAPGGKMIDLVTMNGITMGAVRALDKKLSRIAAAAGMQMEPQAA